MKTLSIEQSSLNAQRFLKEWLIKTHTMTLPKTTNTGKMHQMNFVTEKVTFRTSCYKGTLLPLWTFNCEEDKRKQVTALCWSTKFNDMFAISYGSYDYMRQGPGMISCFSLKNPSYPEIIYQTDSGVMCIDFHKSVKKI
jgi:hypothetical protein